MKFICMKYALTIFMFVILTGYAGCQAQDQQNEYAEAIEAAQTWLELLEQQKYGKSWDKAARIFRDAIPREHWIEAMKTMRHPLGNTLSRLYQTSSYHTTLPGAPDGQYLVIQYKTSFANKEGVIETITPALDDDGQWRVSGYYIK